MPNRSGIMVSMNRLSTEKRAAVVACLVEGNSIRATCRMTGVSEEHRHEAPGRPRLACSIYQDRVDARPALRAIQCDEIWAFCYAKQRTSARGQAGRVATATSGRGSRSTPTRSSYPSYLVGARELGRGAAVHGRPRQAARKRVQLTTDGHKPYLGAVRDAFGATSTTAARSSSTERRDGSRAATPPPSASAATAHPYRQP